MFNNMEEGIIELVHALLNTKDNQISLLQQINDELLSKYQLSYGNYLKIYPKDVEIYYVNKGSNNPFVDTNMHCMLDPKTNTEIWGLQSNRFGKLYIHRKGMGGVDVCLSDSNDYALCCSIKSAEVNGEDIWSGIKIRDIILKVICENNHLSDKMEALNLLNSNKSSQVLSLRQQPSEEYIYHIRRSSLRRRDKYVLSPLRSLSDLWSKKLVINNVQKVNLYMKAHPDENVLDVLREHGFRYIPLEIKIRYKIDRKAKLYE
jgi:hypothetical protein